MYFILIVFAFSLLFATYVLFQKDFAQPAVILCAYFAAALTLALSQYRTWHLYEYSLKAGCILIVGVLSFVFGCLAAQMFLTGSTSKRRQSELFKISFLKARIKLDKNIVLFCVIQAFVTLALFLWFFRGSVHVDSLAAQISAYKDGRGEGEIRLPMYLNVMIKFNETAAYATLLTLIYNSIADKLNLSDCLLFIIPMAYAVVSLLMANRGNLLQLVMGSLCGWYILVGYVNGKPDSATVIRKTLIVVIPTLCLFWMFMLFRMSETSFDMEQFIQYISSYVSGSIPALDLYALQEKGTPPEWFGQETFLVLNNNLHSLFGFDVASMRFLEFRSGYGRSVVNIYTGFRRFYHDFRMPGVIILPFLQGVIMSKLYLTTIRKSRFAISFPIVLFCKFVYTVPYLMIDETFYSVVFSISGIANITILYLMYRFFFLNSRIAYRFVTKGGKSCNTSPY